MPRLDDIEIRVNRIERVTNQIDEVMRYSRNTWLVVKWVGGTASAVGGLIGLVVLLTG